MPLSIGVAAGNEDKVVISKAVVALLLIPLVYWRNASISVQWHGKQVLL